VELPTVKGSILYEKKLDRFVKWAEEQQKADAESRAKVRADLKIIEGKRRLAWEKQACTKDIIKRAVEEEIRRRQEAAAKKSARKKKA
jgi:hypothetical protein